MENEFQRLTARIIYSREAFLDYIKKALERKGIHGITSTQALVIKNIGKEEKPVGRVTKSSRYYVGKNCHYNIEMLLRGGYVGKEIDRSDERQAILSLTPKGYEILDIIDNAITSQDNALLEAGISDTDMATAIKTLNKLEGFLIEAR